MRKELIAGNWKMNFTRKEAKDLLAHLKSLLFDVHSKIDVVVCPPSVFLDLAQTETKLSNIKLGAQNVAYNPQSAFTGEISPAMLREFGCEYVIIGHSERRSLLNEPDVQIASKFALAKEAGITPILCVGEQAGEGFAVVGAQISAVLQKVGVQAMQSAVIAYEPVWAIGTGKTPSPQQIQDTHAQIREMIAAEVRIIYGGSMKSENAAEILRQPDVDGGLIGGASLKAQDFSDICHIAMGIAK